MAAHPPEDFLIDVEPWERQPHETDEAWLAFRTFRDLDPPRTLGKLREHYTEQMTARHPSLFRNWSMKWRWRSRVAAYDVHLDRIRQRAHERTIEDMSEKHARMAQAGLTLVARRLMGNAEAGVTAIDMNEVEWRDLISGLSALVKLERVARGEPADRGSTELSGPGGGPIRIEPVVPMEDADPAEDVRRVRTILSILEESGAIRLPEESTEPRTAIPAEVEGGDRPA